MAELRPQGLGPGLFTRTSRDGTKALDARLNDKHIARLIKHTVLQAGLRADLPEKDRLALYSGHSLRAGLATAAQADEAAVKRRGRCKLEIGKEIRKSISTASPSAKDSFSRLPMSISAVCAS